jgi:hypothetical protein
VACGVRVRGSAVVVVMVDWQCSVVVVVVGGGGQGRPVTPSPHHHQSRAPALLFAGCGWGCCTQLAQLQLAAAVKRTLSGCVRLLCGHPPFPWSPGGHESERRRLLASGFTGVLAKPFFLADLQAVLVQTKQ